MSKQYSVERPSSTQDSHQLLHKWFGGKATSFENKIGHELLLEIAETCERRRPQSAPVQTDIEERAREQLAAIEHERWSDWQKWVHAQGDRSTDGMLHIRGGLVNQWERQIATPYEQLSEAEKNGDHEQVDRYWPIVQQLIADAIAADRGGRVQSTNERLREFAEEVKGVIANAPDQTHSLDMATLHIPHDRIMNLVDQTLERYVKEDFPYADH